MEEERKENELPEETEQPVYHARPWWQVWGARIALVLFILLVIMYYINVSRGGF